MVIKRLGTTLFGLIKALTLDALNYKGNSIWYFFPALKVSL